MTCHREARLFQYFQSLDDITKENVTFSLSLSFLFHLLLSLLLFVCLNWSLRHDTGRDDGGRGLAVPLCRFCHRCVPSPWAGSYFYSLYRKGKRNSEVFCYSPRVTQVIVVRLVLTLHT